MVSAWVLCGSAAMAPIPPGLTLRSQSRRADSVESRPPPQANSCLGCFSRAQASVSICDITHFFNPPLTIISCTLAGSSLTFTLHFGLPSQSSISMLLLVTSQVRLQRVRRVSTLGVSFNCALEGESRDSLFCDGSVMSCF